MLKKQWRLLREPFVQFLILGLILFFTVRFVQSRRDRESREIIVNNERIGQMIMTYKLQTGAIPNKDQLDAMIENYIREEISYREAKKMGLDKDDEIIRRRLSQKFDFLQTDLTPLKEPGERELKIFYQQHPELFRKEAVVSFSHVYFSTENSTDSLTFQRATAALQQLNKLKLPRAPETGDPFPLQYEYTDQTMLDLKQNFGDKPIARELFTIPVNVWAGPLQSGYGWHLVYVIKRDTASPLPFESVRDQVKSQYTEAEKIKQNKVFFDKLSEKYLIKREYLDSK